MRNFELKKGNFNKPTYCRFLEIYDNEIISRANKKYRKEHPNAKTRHREHGWYLPNDDE